MAKNVSVTITQSGRTPSEVNTDLVAAMNFAIRGVAENFGNNAILNAPIDLTPLRKSIKAAVLKKATVSSPTAKAEVSADRPYAFKVHEQHDDRVTTRQFRAGTKPGGTASQPSTVEGGPGGKYLERVANFRFEQYSKFVAAFADAAMKNANLPDRLPDTSI